MTISPTYDAMNSKEQSRWAILYMVIGHRGDLDPNLLHNIRVQLVSYKLAPEPNLVTLPAAESPVEPIDANQVTFLKWPLKSKKAPMTPELAGEIRAKIRSSVNSALIQAGNEVLQTDVKPAGAALTGDKGVPPTPDVGPYGVPLWPAGVVAVIASFPLVKWISKQ